jgi:hypothetical protein
MTPPNDSPRPQKPPQKSWGGRPKTEVQVTQANSHWGESFLVWANSLQKWARYTEMGLYQQQSL